LRGTVNDFGVEASEGDDPRDNPDVDLVERNLKRYQALIAPQRRDTPAPPWMAEYLEERGLMEPVKSTSASSRRELDELRRAYGEAVARVPGAQDEDLLILHRLGLLFAQGEDADLTKELIEPESGNTPVHRGLQMVDLGSAHHRQGNLDAAIRCYIEALLGADLGADNELVVMGKLGTAFEQQGDIDGALRWYTKAATAGDIQAMTSLGLTYAQRGKIAEAIRWLEPAADAGQARAMGALGLALRERAFAEIERGKLSAAKETGAQSWVWLRKAAEAGEPTALSLVAEADQKVRNLGATQPKAPSRDTPQPQKGGCYIATAVYGSYDAPQVLTLRRFRDERLALSAVGRACTSAYYAVSPPMARHFEEGTVTNRLIRLALDRLVDALAARGYADDLRAAEDGAPVPPAGGAPAEPAS